ncbi:MAG: hypothetical protein WAT93_02275 [Pontixanthobacter sp.]
MMIIKELLDFFLRAATHLSCDGDFAATPVFNLIDVKEQEFFGLQ